MSADIPSDQGARFHGLANLAAAGSSAQAGGWGLLIDVVSRFLTGDACGTGVAFATMITFASLLPLYWLRTHAAED